MEKLDKSYILLNSNIGFEFEFFSNYSNTETKHKLEKYLSKKINLEDKHHSEFVPTADYFKLEPDFSGGEKMVELVTGPLEYADAKIILIKILRWIDKNGTTNDTCGIHLNISFNKTKFGNDFLRKLNVLKFILNFNENIVYNSFPIRKNNSYAKSIKYIEPLNKIAFYNSDIIDSSNFIVPNEKYYGINFTKLISNYLEFRYLGGKDYQKKVEEISYLQDYFILTLFKYSNDNEFNYQDKIKLKQILNEYNDINQSYLSFANFMYFFPKIKILIDLDSEIRTIDLFWNKIRNQIYTLLSKGNLKEGYLNYDTSTGRLQLKDCILTDSFYLTNVDIIDSKIQGIVEDCDIFNSEVSFAEVIHCNLFNNTIINNSKVENTYANKSVVLNDCNVTGPHSIINGTMNRGIFRKGKITKITKFNNTEIIEFEEIENKIL